MYENDPPFQRVFMSYKICSKSLWRALQHYEPTLAKNYKVEHRPYLDTDKWDGRLDATAAWLRKLVNPNAPGVRMVSAEEALRYGVTDGEEVPLRAHGRKRVREWAGLALFAVPLLGCAEVLRGGYARYDSYLCHSS